MKCRGCGHTKKEHTWTDVKDGKAVPRLGRCSHKGAPIPGGYKTCSCSMFQAPTRGNAKRLAEDRECKRKAAAKAKHSRQVPPGASAKRRRVAKKCKSSRVPIVKAFEDLVAQGVREGLEEAAADLQKMIKRHNEEIDAWIVRLQDGTLRKGTP